MAKKSEKAAAAVEALFKKKPDATTDEFLEVAVAAEPSLKGVGKRSFNATYLLPLKRAAGSKKKGGKKKAKATRRRRTRKAAKAAAPRRRRRRRASSGNGTVSPAARERVRELILDRDREVLDTVAKKGDPKAAYELGARLDTYIDELARALNG